MISSLEVAPAGLALHWDNEVKTHLRLDTNEERARVESVLIPAATEWIQSLTNRQLINATWVFLYPSFAAAAARSPRGAIYVPRPPLQEVVSIEYFDSQNTLQTWGEENYVVYAPRGPMAKPGWIWPVSGPTWYPSSYSRPDAVQIKAVCGYGPSAATVPGGLRQAMLLLVSELFERRELVVTGTIVQAAPVGAVHLGLSYLAEI